MRRHLSEPRLVIASHNAGKVREIGVLLARFAVEVVSAAELGLPEPDETGLSFEANAELKAVAAARASDLPALADDSGLVVPALGGAPGIYSARWAGADKDFGRAMRRLEAELTGVSDRRAHFVAVLALAWPDGHVESFRGEAHGRLVWPPRGTRGFGYDPIFIHDGQTLSYGELEPDDKHRMSHRAIAFEKLLASCLR